MAALLAYGHHTPALYRGLSKWRPLLQRLLNPLRPPDQRVGDVEGELRLRIPVARLLYDICRVQKLEDRDLGWSSDDSAPRSRLEADLIEAYRSTSQDLFDEDLIDHMFELVEGTRGHVDETLNYSLVKLLVRTPSFARCSSLSGF